METDGFKTIRAAVEGTPFKEKRSKFIGYAFPVDTRDDIDRNLAALHKKHSGASHYCYAWRLGANTPEERTNDDGEPRHTAGPPILGQITSFGITGILLVVIRFYGGKKLGTGGLIHAYRTAARSALDRATIVFKEFESSVALQFSYAQLHKILHLINQYDGKILERRLEQHCRILVSVGNSKLKSFSENIGKFKGVGIEVR